jgi:hypothetical protein
MLEYKAPLRDIRFVNEELWQAEKHYSTLSGCESPTVDIRSAILERRSLPKKSLHPSITAATRKVVILIKA